MKRFAMAAALVFFCLQMSAVTPENNAVARRDSTEISEQKKKTEEVRNEDGEIIKTGLSFGPLPVVAYDADKGLQYGALLNIYNFGNGSDYPNPKSTWYFEVSAYTKGSQKYIVSYDDKSLIPGVRISTAARWMMDSAMEFYGYNGYQSYFDYDMHTGFYRHRRNMGHFKLDFVGEIMKNFYWEAGYHFNYIATKPFTTKKYELENTLFEMYNAWGIIPDNLAGGGISSALRAGLMYDSRDIEAAPTKGIWAEVHYIYAPKFLGSTVTYNKLNATFRHYVPLYRDKLIFAYRLNYQAFFGDAPWYALPFYTLVGPYYDYDGIGGYRTARGLMLTRVQGLHTGFYNAEIRWRFVDFVLWKQNISLALSGFCDGACVFKGMDLTNRTGALPELYAKYVDTSSPDRLHVSAGGGLRFIMNRNFIVAAEYARCMNTQDGKGAFYLNTGFLF